MKLNFWQRLAVVLLVVGLAWWLFDYKHRSGVASPPPGNPATTPTTVP